MYETYFGFTRSPFDLSPDPYFLLGTPGHSEAYACLYYAVARRKGFVVLTGEVGTGKTLLTRMLLQAMTQANVASAYVFNPRLTGDDFLRYLLDELNIPVTGSKSQMLHDLNKFLIARHTKGLTTALVIDEAHLLGAEVLEEIRLLTNLETTTHKLLQIVLVGQPELDGLLDSVNLRQLKQRVAVRFKLTPLTPAQTAAYIRHRVQRAGTKSRPEVLFPDNTVESITLYSGGIPRLINNICENALISAFARQQQSVTPDLVREVASDLKLEGGEISATSLMSQSAFPM